MGNGFKLFSALHCRRNSMASQPPLFGQLGEYDVTSEFGRISFMIQQALGAARFGTPVKIVKVHGGGVGPAPTVDVQPLIKMMDIAGNSSSHGTIYGVPVYRNQAGKNVIINDPLVNDTGWLSVGDRDMQSFKNNGGKESNPGSSRRHSMSDGIYHAAICMQVTPNQYLHYIDGVGIDLVDCNGNVIHMQAAGINLNGVIIDQTGKISAPSDVIANSGAGFVSLVNHIHSGVTPGGGDTATPVAGT